MFLERDIKKELIDASKKYPAVIITGPRQSGKTTLAKKVFSHKTYLSLEDIDIRDFADSDPRAFLNRLPDGAILDEIQRAPVLLSYIQGILDSSGEKGLFILTGSNQFSLLDSINQSLAGRVSLSKLLPLSINELMPVAGSFDVDDYIFKGFYPGIYSAKLNPVKAYNAYYQTYVERDVRSLINIKDLSLFNKFMKLCAGRTGQILNANSLANEVGVSNKTIVSWLSILQASYIIYLLPPWHDNISKRLIKSPKLYFYDVGLASFLLGNRRKEHIATHPLRGNLFENMVIMDLIKEVLNKGMEPDFYFYRDSNGNEVDLLIPDGNNFIPMEIKSTGTFHANLLKSNNYINKVYPDRIKDSYLIYSGEIEQEVKGISIINYKNLHKLGYVWENI